MKKLSLFLLGCFATSFMASAQDVTADMFTAPANTGANMTVGVNASKFDQFEGGQIGAFYDLNGDGTLSCVGLETISTGFFGLALWGDDSSTPAADGLASGAAPQFAILHNGNVVYIAEIPQFTGYVTNGIVNITDAVLAGGAGCTDASACNGMFMYSDVDYSDDGSCTYPDAGYDCDGVCLNDADADGVCDEFEVAGCTDGSACNFDGAATDDDGSCTYPDAGYDCDGVCLNDADLDGVCDEFEVVGCQDDAYDNFDASATDAGSCEGLLGCTDAGYFEFDAAAEVDNGSCETLIVTGCTNPAASNYDPAANLNIAEGEEGACIIVGVNFTPVSDAENTSIIVTSNNMSVLFPVNNAGLWNTDQSNVEAGDIIAAVYETGRLNNDFLGYSAISGLANAGSGVWTGDQLGLAVFGADNMINNGFEPNEDLKWLVSRGGVVYNATVTYATPAYDGSYQEGTYVTVNSVILGAPADMGCVSSNYMEFDPMATVDDGSCATMISVGCMDANFVNYAGADVDADAVHDNANNFGDVFVENYTVDLNTGMTTASGSAAIFHDVSVCQSQLEGCTDPMANNYDAFATQNDATICDWSLNGMTEYNVDQNGNILSIDYNFGAVDAANENDGIVGSDFDNANVLFDEGYLDVEAHVIDNLADVMEWIDMDEARDAVELADTISDMQARYDANDAAWDAAYNANEAFLNDSITNTLDSAAVAFAADEAADLLFLNNTIDASDALLAETIAASDALLAATIDASDALLAATIAASDAFLAETIATSDDLLALTISNMQADYDANDAAHVALEGLITDSLDYHRDPIVIDLGTGWNTIAYYLHHESPVVAQFVAQFGTEEAVQDNINIVKNNEGLFYWPDFLFDGLGMMEPGQGYQVRVKDATNGKSDFIFSHAINADDYRVLSPTVPAWAIEMDVQNHPNDVRTLVRVVNMLGQEVNPTEQFNGEILLYMYNDGSVEKIMVD